MALSCGALADTVVPLDTLAVISAQEVTGALSAVPPGGVPIVTTPADATVGAFSVVQALLALSCLPITGPHVRQIYVVVALAWLTAASGLRRVPVITRGTILTTRTCIALFAVADDLFVTVVLVTRCSKMTSTVGSIWAGAWPTVTIRCFTQNWVTIETIGTSVTHVSPSVVPTVNADPSPLVTFISVSVALAGSTVREAPVTCLASVTLLTKSTGTTLALARELVTKPRQ